eukprot:3489617-Prymnesium_polylepis.1
MARPLVRACGRGCRAAHAVARRDVGSAPLSQPQLRCAGHRCCVAGLGASLGLPRRWACRMAGLAASLGLPRRWACLWKTAGLGDHTTGPRPGACTACVRRGRRDGRGVAGRVVWRALRAVFV